MHAPPGPVGTQAEARQRYEILGKVADGAVAEVFRAHDRARGVDVVLKILRSELTTDREVVGRFLDEARVCQKLEHPGVVRHLACDRLPDGRVYLVIEALDGADLASHLHRVGPLGPVDAVKLFVPLCAALEYVHQRGVVHRDLKPDNVFLEGGLTAFRPKLLDFGLAHFKGPKSVRTATGAIVASPEYTPPECIDGQRADALSDQYSLGVLFYECLTGSPPFVAANYGELLLKHLKEAPPRLPASAQVLEPIVMRCLAKAPADRYASVAEVGAALAACGEVISGRTLVSRPGQEKSGETQKPKWMGGEFGVYQTQSVLGQGSMGTVYLARHSKLGRQVALKVLRPEHSRNADLVQRFLQEARSVNAINHEHIVEIFDFAEDVGPNGEPRVYCVMELLAGASLSGLMRREPLSVARVLNISRQIASALAAAHKVGVVHRDIKPDNIFVTERSGVSDYVKVLDFGVAKLVVPLGDAPKVGTMAGQIIGTPAYMAPEQASGAGSDHRVDIYALGVVLYQLLSARLPFTGEVFGKLVVQIMTQAPPPLEPATPGGEPVPPALEALVMRLLAKEPGHRPQSMEEVERALMEVSNGTAPAPPPKLVAAEVPAFVKTPAPLPSMAATEIPALITTREPAFAPGRSKTPFVAAAAAAAVVALAGGGFWLTRAEPRPPPQSPAPLPSPAAVPPIPAKVNFELASVPPGAKVTRGDTGEEVGVTPCAFSLPRGDAPIAFAFELAGHERAVFELRPNRDFSIKPRLNPAKVAPSPKKELPKAKVSDESTVNPFE